MVMPLQDLKVLDLSRVLSGPFCTMVLGDLGADVLKVEEPEKGDEIRMWPPFVGGESCAFLSVNRNKRSMTLDLKTEQGKEVFFQLVASRDVLVENFRPGTMERLGLGFDAIHKVNPRMVYCGISGYGRTGPYRNKPGYDAIVQAHGGLMSITGEPGRSSVRAGVSLVDLSSGLLGAIGILAALKAREITGRGQIVDTSLFESLISLLTYHAQNYLSSGVMPQKLGTAHPSAVPYQSFNVRDGALMVGALNQKFWIKLCEALSLTELVDDPRFRTAQDRSTNRVDLSELLSRALAGFDMAEASRLLEAAGVPYAPINDIGQVFRDPQALFREMLIQIAHPKLGKISLVGIPIKLSETPGGINRPPPMLGQHTEEVLKELNYGEAQVIALKQKKAV